MINLESIDLEKTLNGEENFEAIELMIKRIVKELGAMKVAEIEDGETPVFSFKKINDEYNLVSFLYKVVDVISTGIIQRNALKGMILANRKSLISKQHEIANNLYLTGTEIYLGVFEKQIACIVISGEKREVYKGKEILQKLKEII